MLARMMGRRINTDNAVIVVVVVVVVAMTFFFSVVVETGAVAVTIAKAGAFVGKNDGTTNRYRY